MRVLVLGSGGREHALAWSVSKSEHCRAVFCAPGNGGTLQVGENISLDPQDPKQVVDFVRTHKIDLTIIGPEAPLVSGVADSLSDAGYAVFGPSSKAAQLEASKSFCKQICQAAQVPTAISAAFEDASSAKRYLREHGAPIVVKADGLAAGKGVVVAETEDEAASAIEAMFAGSYGKAGSRILLEEKLIGVEASFFALCDGVDAVPLASARDYKRVGDGDVGPNTGGMGAFSPHPLITEPMQIQIMEEIIFPSLRYMQAQGTPYRGVLYAGLMIDGDKAKLIEFNARFGDPECQLLMLRLKSDALLMLDDCANGRLDKVHPIWDARPAVTITMAAKGYPLSYDSGEVISGLDEASRVEGCKIFHAGTRLDEGSITSSGGRVLNICAVGDNFAQARARAYQALAIIEWPGGFARKDIALDMVESND